MKTILLSILITSVATSVMGVMNCPEGVTPTQTYCQNSCACLCGDDGHVHCDRNVQCSGAQFNAQDFCEASCTY
ncbi:unnamed protein product [Tilletia controversa]|nr:unnamed protein product [Tilletia controversa]CAD6923860.1 unnamed protein product [Tilletia controversa]CAD6972514.1 unnamed protein product [Tilletia controversa]CAD6984819.1 unnamed protein product [Tilletia controversa]